MGRLGGEWDVNPYTHKEKISYFDFHCFREARAREALAKARHLYDGTPETVPSCCGTGFCGDEPNISKLSMKRRIEPFYTMEIIRSGYKIPPPKKISCCHACCQMFFGCCSCKCDGCWNCNAPRQDNLTFANAILATVKARGPINELGPGRQKMES